MSRLLFPSFWAVSLGMLVTCAELQAQNYPNRPGYSRPGYSSYSGPTLSPYLNLLRGGSPAANYYMGVVPEIERRRTEYQINQDLLQLERRETTLQTDVDELLPTLPSTGHGASFMDYGTYYRLGPNAAQAGTAYRPPSGSGRTSAGASSAAAGRPGTR